MSQGNREALTELIKRKTLSLGFSYCGISKAEFLEEEANHLDNWLKKSYHGKMSYMENYFDKRLDPRLLVDGAKSVITVLLNYFPEKEQVGSPKISKYAYGKDYHFVIKEKLKFLVKQIEEEIGEFNGRAFVDSAPVMDKAWAKRSGLGWMGKNTNIINKSQGSFFFIGELIVDFELDYDGPIKDYCGTCTKCLDACPTDALVAPYEIDGSKCISYLTIELKEQIPSEFKGKMEDWMFGCDICQDVCPWNRFSKPHTEKDFQPHEKLLEMNSSEWEEITEELFRDIFRKSAVKRTKFTGLKRNIDFLAKD